MSSTADESSPPTAPEKKETEIQDLPDPADESAEVKGGAGIEPCWEDYRALHPSKPGFDHSLRSAKSDRSRNSPRLLTAASLTRSDFALDDAFWASFHEAHWERLGTVLEHPFGRPIATPDEAFDCLVAASDRYRAGDGSVALEFCIGHTRLMAGVGDHLPRRADGSIAGYAERVTRQLDGRRFGLVVEDVQAYDATLWLRLRDFLRGLYVHTGVPGDSAKATVFAGNYDRTPFGLHRGSSGNFMFVVDGQKRMRTWPDAFFQGKEDLTYRLDYERYNSDSIVMDAEPGDVIYWPSDYWHIGESVNGEMSAAVSVALFMEPRHAEDLMTQARGFVRKRMSHADGLGPVDVFPDRVAANLEAIGRLAARGGEVLRDVGADAGLSRALLISLMNKMTAYGFLRPPAPSPKPTLTDEMLVRGFPEHPISWVRTDDDELLVSSCGHAFSVTASPRIIGLLAALNGGEPRSVRSIIDEHAGSVIAGGIEYETSGASIRALLEKLAANRGITVAAS